jgi:hypothetical protein
MRIEDGDYTEPRDDESPVRPYSGTVERPKPLLELREDRWATTITVTALELPGIGKTFEVRVTRFGGPKLDGTPDPVGVRIAQVDDVIAERAGERAREIAMRAAEQINQGVAPDLKALARTVREDALF